MVSIFVTCNFIFLILLYLYFVRFLLFLFSQNSGAIIKHTYVTNKAVLKKCPLKDTSKQL